jgi:hypothetical protein
MEVRMKKIFLVSTMLTGFMFIMIMMLDTTSAQSGIKFMSPDFAKKLCNAWNQSNLPSDLGTGGSDWISQGEEEGKQTMVFWVKNCSTPRVQLTVENQGGKAVCTYGGAAQTASPDWKIYPPTDKWYKCATGVNPMWQLMGNFKGNMGTAMKNMGNFKIFFKVVGGVAKSNNADYKTGCDLDSGQIEEIEEYIRKI